jgi:hypothetical protein
VFERGDYAEKDVPENDPFPAAFTVDPNGDRVALEPEVFNANVNELCR